MKKICIFGAMALILITSTHSYGQITMEDLYRESYAQVFDYLPPYDGVSEAEDSQISGAFEAYPAVFWEDGHCQTHQVSDISSDGEVIHISGFLQADMGRSIPGEVNVFESRSLIFVDFSTDTPFVISGDIDIQGSHHESMITVVDEGTMTPLFNSGTNPPSGSFSGVCSGTGPYKLEVIHSFVVNQGDTGGNESSMDFEITLMPEGGVATSNKTWDSVKALFH